MSIKYRINLQTSIISILSGLLLVIFFYPDLLQHPWQGYRRVGFVSIIFITLVIITYVGVQNIFKPVFIRANKNARFAMGIFACLFAGLLILMIPVNIYRPVYVFLPKHSLVIEPASVEVVQFSTAVGEPGANSLKRIGGRFSWEGRTGESAILVFKSNTSLKNVTVNWDGREKQYDLSVSAQKGSIYSSMNFSVPVWHFIFWLLISWMAITWISFAAILIINSISTKNRPTKFAWSWYALPMLASWSLYLLALWPGMMSPDSIMQWQEAQTLVLTDAHPAFHTMGIYLLSRLWNSPTVVPLAHIIILALLVAWGLGELQKQGLAPLFCWGISLIMALLPINGLMLATVWKDITYALALFALFIQFLKIYLSNGQWLHGRWNLAGLLVSCLLVALVRHNGLPVAAACLLVMLLLYGSLWRQLGAVLFCFIALWLGISGPVYTLLKVKPYPGFGNILFLDHINAHIHADTPLLPEESVYLNSLIHLQDWPYDCADSDIRKMDGPIQFDYFSMENSQPRDIALRLFFRDPMVDINHTLCASELVWRVTTRTYIYTTPLKCRDNGSINWIDQHIPGINEDSKLPGIVPYLCGLMPEKSPTTKPAFYLLAALFLLGMAAIRRKSWKLLIITCPLLIQTAVMLLVNFAQDFRYMYSTILIAIFSLGILLLPGSEDESKMDSQKQ